MKDVHSNSVAKALLSYSTTTSNRTGTGMQISDYQGIAKVILSVGALNGTVTLSISHSDTSGGTYTNVATYASVNTANSETENILDIRGLKPFIRATTAVGGISSTDYGVIIILPRPSSEPVN